MNRGERLIREAVLTALYLRGGPDGSAPRSGFGRVDLALSAGGLDLGTVESALRAAGRWQEASVVSTSGVLDASLALVEAGSVLTWHGGGYPRGWRERLGASAPLALWRSGDLPSGRAVGVVGSRALTPAEHRFAIETAREASSLGGWLVTGGARGADESAWQGALASAGPERCVILLPYGLDRRPGRDGVFLSACPPGSDFTTAAAMERNALIYAAADLTVVAAVRFGEGGTWHGAASALRRRLGSIAVRRDDQRPGHAALRALGASWISSPSELASLLAAAGPVQPSLFIQESRSPYAA